MAYPKIEGERLDIVLQKMREKGESTPLEGAEHFQSHIDNAGGTANYASIETQLVDYRMPMVKPDIFKPHNMLGGLVFVRDVLIPSWPDSQEIKDLLVNTINDVLVLHQDVMERRNSGIAV